MIGITQEPSITRGFVFKSVFGDSPKRCKELLERALDIRIADVEIVHTEHELDVLAYARAGRLDVHVTNVEGNHYDVEIQSEGKGNELVRARHYQALIDASQLKKGVPVEELRQCVVLRYVHGEDVDSDPFVNDIRSEIRRLVQDPEWLEDFMTFEEELEVARYNAEKRGYDQGIQEGIEQGTNRLAKSLTELGVDASLVAKALELARDSREDEQ